MSVRSDGQELWRECADWLTRCGLLRPDHKANWETSQIQDLAYTLRDGVLLCNLLIVLDPGCIDIKDVNLRPQMAQFLCMRNIKVFLRTCHEKFKIAEEDLFDAYMLFDLSNFHRVLCTISKLSQCPKALAKNIIPFSAQKTESVEDIYKELKSAVALGDIEVTSYSANHGDPQSPDPPWVQFTIPNSAEEGIEEIYEDLCYVTFSSKAPELATSPHSLETRDYVIRELVDTECNYVDVLESILKHFMRPLSPFLKSHEKDIFFGIEELHDIHSKMLSQLKRATKGCVPGQGAPRLADVFLEFKDQLVIYGDYCSNLTNAQELLRTLQEKNEAFNEQLLKCQKDHREGRIQLRDILSVPMQRILKYPLLLKNLVSETAPTHEDYLGLERANEAMIDVADCINEVKRDSEVLDLLKKLQESIIDWKPERDLATYGRLILDGELKVKAHEDQKIRTRYAFVFDKLLLLCKVVKDNQYSYWQGVSLAEYRIEDGPGRKTLRGDGRWHAHFFLVRRTKGAAFTLYAKSDEVKTHWMNAIRNAIDNLEPAGCRRTDHKFVLKTFQKPVTCYHCSKFLKGKIFQGYCCSVCGAGVHKACIELSGRCGGTAGTLTAATPLPINQRPSERSLNCYMWYVAEMSRERATENLEGRVDGTFLLRERPDDRDTHYALSLKTDNTVKHMRVFCKQIDDVPHYYLSESRFFRSVVELVTYYEKTSLGENFVGLDVTLKWPFRRVVATVIHEFRPLDATQLGLRIGAKVLVVSKEGDARGWWKGKTIDRGDNRSGFFPKECVRVD